MRSLLLTLTFLALCAVQAFAATLTFTDPNTNELGTKIERADVACTATPTFVEIGSAPANATTYVDATTAVGHEYCYRVRAWNNSMLDGSGVVQYSAYSGTGGIAYPLPKPGTAPSLTGVTVAP